MAMGGLDQQQSGMHRKSGTGNVMAHPESGKTLSGQNKMLVISPKKYVRQYSRANI